MMTSLGKFILRLAVFWILVILASVPVMGVRAIILQQSYDLFLQEAYFASSVIFQFALVSTMVFALLGTFGTFIVIFVLLCVDKE